MLFKDYKNLEISREDILYKIQDVIKRIFKKFSKDPVNIKKHIENDKNIFVED